MPFEIEWVTDAVQRLVLWAGPSGGQAVARRNAWSSLAEDKRRRNQRLEAERSAAAAVAERPREMAAV